MDQKKETKQESHVVHPMENPINEKDKLDPIKPAEKAPTYDPVI